MPLDFLNLFDRPDLFVAALAISTIAVLLTLGHSVSTALSQLDEDKWWLLLGCCTPSTHFHLFVVLLALAGYTALAYRGLVWLLGR